MAWPAWALDAWNTSLPYLEKAAIWRGYENDLQTLVIYAVGIAVYTALVFTFYRNLSIRDPFHTGWGKAWGAKVVRFLESIFVFPLMSFLYFGVLAGSLFILAKSQTTYAILLLSMSVVVGVRVTAFVNESMSQDLAKLLPLGLLGVLLVDPTNATVQTAVAHFKATPALLPVLARFFAFFIFMETALKAAQALGRRIRARRARRPLKRETLVQHIAEERDVAPRSVPVKETPSKAREGPAASEPEEPLFERVG